MRSEVSKIERFLQELRDSADRINSIYTHGSCVRLFKMLRVFYPEAQLYWSECESHAITRIGSVYYDIGGEVSSEYIKFREFALVPHENYAGYFMIKYSEVEGLKTGVVVEKYFKPTEK